MHRKDKACCLSPVVFPPVPHLEVEGLPVDGDGEGGLVLVVDADDGAAQPHAAAPHAANHLVAAGVVGEEPGALVQHEPAVLPALHHVGPLGQRALHGEGGDRGRRDSDTRSR